MIRQATDLIGALVTKFMLFTTYIENGFQQKKKTGVVFHDLIAAYDTIWHIGLLVKMSKSLWVVMAMEMMLQNRQFQVVLRQ